MKKIIQANKELGKKEAKYYDDIHLEIFNKQEQERIKEKIEIMYSFNNSHNALDIGAGTGNITLKLVELGYDVIAVDLCKDYLKILKRKAKKYKNLKIIEGDIEKIKIKGKFDYILCYSSLHHFPDYLKVIKKMCKLLNKNGTLYIDHEVCDEYWERNRFIQKIYDLSCGWLNGFYVYFIKGIKRRDIQFDYSLADYHTKKEHRLNHTKIKKLLMKNFDNVYSTKYLLNKTKIFNPLKLFYYLLYGYDTIMWTAKKNNFLL